MLFAHLFLARHSSAFAAYNALQARLLRGHLRRGGTLDGWCDRMAPAFRRRYGWMVVEPVEMRRAA